MKKSEKPLKKERKFPKAQGSGISARRIGRLFVCNPVLCLGLALPFAAVTCTRLQAAAVISIAMAVTLIPSMLIGSLFGKKAPRIVCMIVCCIVSAVILQLMRLYLSRVFKSIFDVIWIYYPLMAVSSALTYYSPRAGKMTPGRALISSVCLSIGFAAVCFVCAFIRELLAFGSVWGVKVSERLYTPGAASPFFGFIMIGFLAALLRGIARLAAASARGRRKKKQAGGRESGAAAV